MPYSYVREDIADATLTMLVGGGSIGIIADTVSAWAKAPAGSFSNDPLLGTLATVAAMAISGYGVYGATRLSKWAAECLRRCLVPLCDGMGLD